MKSAVSSQQSAVRGKKFLFFIISVLLFTCHLSLFTSFFSHASEPTLQDEFNQANQAYFARDFNKAISLYSDLEKKGLVSGDLYYNLGNTYYRTGQVGQALYYYTKALRYHPRDRDLVANYRYVLSKRADQIEEPILTKIYHTLFFWVDLTTLRELLILSATLYWLFFILWVVRILQKRFILTLALLGGLALNLFVLPTAVAKYYTDRIRVTGVVVAPTAAVYSEPAAGAIKLFELHEGAIAVVRDRTGEFLKIRLPDGKKGWVSQKDFREIR